MLFSAILAAGLSYRYFFWFILHYVSSFLQFGNFWTSLPRSSLELLASMLLLISLDMMTISRGPACWSLFLLKIVIFLFVDSKIFLSTFVTRHLKIKSTLSYFQTIPRVSSIFICLSALSIFLISPLLISFGVFQLAAVDSGNVLFASLLFSYSTTLSIISISQ